MSGNFKLIIEAPLPDLYDLARGIAGTPEPVLGFPVPDGDQQIRDDLEALKANHSREIAGLESLCETLKRDRDALSAERSDLIQRLGELSAREAASSAGKAKLNERVERAQIAECDALARLDGAVNKIEALTAQLDAARDEIKALKEQVATERDLASFKAELLADAAPPAAPEPEPEPEEPEPPAAPVDSVEPAPLPELPVKVSLTGKRLEVLQFIWANKPTHEQFAERFGLKTRQQQANLVSSVRQAVGHKYKIEIVDGVVTATVIEAAEAAPLVKSAPAVQPPQPPKAASAKPAVGTLVRVSLPLLTATTAKGSAKVTSSLFGRVLQHMADGGLYGLDKLKQVGGYASEEAVKTAFLSHKPTLERIGLFVEISAVGARLKVR